MVDISGLRSGARSILDSFLGIFPGAVVISGRRTIEEQAGAMAEDLTKDPSWWPYVPSPASIACKEWVDAHRGASELDIARGLADELTTFPPDELRHLTYHLSGDAFDIRPVTGPVGEEMVGWLQRLVAKHIADGGSAKLLLREGGLVRWHCQASQLPDSYSPNLA